MFWYFVKILEDLKLQQAFECAFYQESYNLIDRGAPRAAEKFNMSTTEPGGWGQEEVCRDWWGRRSSVSTPGLLSIQPTTAGQISSSSLWQQNQKVNLAQQHWATLCTGGHVCLLHDGTTLWGLMEEQCWCLCSELDWMEPQGILILHLPGSA